MEKNQSVQNKIYSIFVLSLLTWGVRLINESLSFPNAFVEETWLFFFRPLAILILGIRLSDQFLDASRRYTRNRFWIWSFFAAAVFCFPYVPDMYASFVKAGEKRSVVLSGAFYLLGILTYGGLRGATCLFVKNRFLRFRFCRHLQTFGLYFVFLFSEYVFFHSWHPITYFPALPMPLPASRFVSNAPQKNLKYLLLETQIDGHMRQKIAQGGSMALSILGEKLADAVKMQVNSDALSSSVVLLLPETFVSLDDGSDISWLIEPVASQVFKTGRVKSLVWVQGAFIRNNNVILGTELMRRSEPNREGPTTFDVVTVLRRKNEQMPMFEVPSKGVSYSVIQNDGPMGEQMVPPEHAELKRFFDGHRLLICYESLFPSNWRFGTPTVIFTNHHLFNEFRLMNWVYFGFLRQLSFLFSSPAKIISNFNSSGILIPGAASLQQGLEDDGSWTVVKLF